MAGRFAKLLQWALLALSLAACTTTDPAAASSRKGYGSGFRIGTPGTVGVPAITASVTYDTSIGNGVDATTGTANLPLRAGASRYFVNSGAASITGSDSNTCVQAQNPATPKATLASGYSCLTDGAGDQMLVAEGSTYSEVLPAMNKSGFSAVYPLVYQSYDPADPTNEAKYGRATANRPVVNTAGTVSLVLTCCQTTPKKFLALRGFFIGGGAVSGKVLSFTGSNGLSNHYVLVENNVLAYTDLVLQQDMRDPAGHFIVRGNSIYDAFINSVAHAQGTYVDGVASLTIEDNFFSHNGWSPTATRATTTASGGPNIYNHNIYMQDTVAGSIRRNLGLDGSATFCSCRGNAIDMRNNVAIDNPISYIAGLGNGYNYVNPNGDWLFVTQNVALGDADINTTDNIPQGTGFTGGNGKLGSRTSFNLLARTRNPSGVNVNAFNTQSSADSPIANMDFHDNVEYSWAAAGAVKSVSDISPGGHSTNPTYENNAWSDPASGSNVNISSHTTPNAYTAAALYTALGFANKAAAVAAWQDHPELHPSRTISTLMLAGYGVAAATPEDLALSRSNFILTGSYTGVIAGALDGSTITASGLPACITIDSPSRSFIYNSGCSAGTGSFTLTETPLAGSPHNTTISYSIAASPTLGTITLSQSLVSGTPSSGTFVGTYPGGVVEGGFLEIRSGAPAGFQTGPTVGESQGMPSRIWRYDGTAFTSGNMVVRETLIGSTNGTHDSTISYAAAPWTPASLGTKLKMWLRGSDLAGANGSSITTWADASANSNNATGGTSQPTVSTAALNGYNVANFNNTATQYMALPTGLLTGRSQLASFAVWKLAASPATASATSGPVFGDFGTDASSNHEPFTDGNFYSDYASTVRKTITGVAASTSWRIQGFFSAANNWRFNLDGTQVFSTATNTVGLNTAPFLGKTAAAPAYLSGQIAEVVDAEGLTTAEEQKVEGYLACRFALQGNLPAGHPYKSVCP